MKFWSVNPTTGEKNKEYIYLTPSQINTKLALAEKAFSNWSNTPISSRTELLLRVADLLLTQKNDLAKLMSTEMGKRIVDGIAEIEKCARVVRFYAEQGPNILTPQVIPTEAKKSYIRFDPLGVTLAIMPWNFPFWQVFRAAAPSLLAGNSMVLKHASSVPGCALAIEQLFVQAGAPLGLFQTLLVKGADTAHIIRHPSLRKIALTGSEDAGRSVASLAGDLLIPTVLELGGSDPFIICADADLDRAITTAATARLLVAGQSCIAAKRFIVEKSIYGEFITRFSQLLATKKLGDPADPATDVGPLINQKAVGTLHDQVTRSLQMGAKLKTGGKKVTGAGFFYPPTLLYDVAPDMPVVAEETFGPVAAVSSFTNINDALSQANHPHFGLGASVWTKDPQNISFFTKNLQAGSVFVNEMVKSDPRLPFGGTHASGYGRELGSFGLYEYTNIKTVWIN